MNSKPLVETAFSELPDGTLVDTIEEPNNSSRSLLAIYRDNRVSYTERFETDDEILLPISRTSGILSEVRFSRGAKSYECAAGLLDQLFRLFCYCLDAPGDHLKLLSCFVVSTWLIEKLPIAPYVAFVGLPYSGKTTALRLLSFLCRHSLLTSDITSPSFYEVCNRVAPTLLIDETATAGDKRALPHLLRTGSTKGSVAIRKNKSFNAYGPKVLCWTQLPSDAALNSRCIIIPLQETNQTGLLRPMDPIVQAAADDIRQMLQQYRFENFYRLSPVVCGDVQLHSRNRDLYEALASPIADRSVRKFLGEYFRSQQNFIRESLSSVQVNVLQILDSCIHQSSYGFTLAHIELTRVVNLRLKLDGESSHTSPHQIGRVLTSFGLIDRKRTNTGYVLIFGRETRDRIHQLVRRYGIEPEDSASRETCHLCMDWKNRSVGLRKSAAVQANTSQSDETGKRAQ